MPNHTKSYQYHNHTLSIPASLLYQDWDLMKYTTYLSKCQRGQLVRTRMGKGKGNFALLSFHHLPESIKDVCIEKLGHYKKMKIQAKQ